MIYVVSRLNRCNSFSRYRASLPYSEGRSQKIDDLPVYSKGDRTSLVPRPRPLTREKGSGDLQPIPRASLSITLIAFPGGIRRQPITLQKAQSMVVAPEILDYFNAMTHPFLARVN